MKSPMQNPVLAAGQAALLILLLLAPGCSKASRAARHLERAEAYFQAGERDKAEIEYLNVLRLRPLHPQAIERLGTIYYDQGRFPRALALLLKSRELNTNNVEARLKAAHILMVGGRPKEARDEVLVVLDLQPTNDEALLLLAESPRSTNDLAAVQQRLAQLAPAISNQAGYHLAHAALAMMQRDSNTAARASLEAVRLGPQSSAAHQVRGGFLLTINDPTNALRSFEAAANLAPVRSLVRLRFAELCLQTGDRARARTVLSNLLAQASDYLPAQVQMFKLDLSEGRLDECEALVNKVLAQEGTHFEAVLARGQVLLARGKREAALKEMERLVGLYPKSAQAQYNYALTLLVNGDLTRTTAALNQALALEPNHADATLLLARLNIRRGDQAAAIASLTDLLRKRPGLVPARMALAEAQALKGAHAEALALYRQLAKDYPQEPQFRFLEGLVLRDQRKPAEAYKAFEAAQALAPDSLQVVQQMVELQLADKQYDAARLLLAAPLAKNPKAAAPLVLLATTYLAQKDLPKAEETLNRAIALDPDARSAYMLLAQVLIATGKQQEALERLGRVVEKNPKDVQALMQVGMLRDSLSQHDAAAEAYRQIIEINPRFQPALNNLAYLYCEHFNRLDEALDLAKRARELAPNDPFSADTLGWVAFRKGDYPWALTLLEETGKAFPAEPEVQYHLGMANYMLGQEEAARTALQRAVTATKDFRGKAEAQAALALLTLDAQVADAQAVAALEKRVKEVPGDPVAARRLAAVCEHRGEIERAVKLYETLLKANPKAVFASLRLAELHATRLNNLAKAMEYARAARNLDPEDARTAQLAGRVALQAGDAKWAFSLLQESARKLPADPDVRFDFAVAAYHLGRVSEAEAGFQDVARAEGNPARTQAARQWLDLIRASSQPALATQALPLAQAVLRTDTNSLPATMVTAAAAEQQGNLAGARQTYERILARNPDFTPATRQLALLRVRQGEDDAQVFALASKAREAYPQDAEVAATLGVLAYRRGDFTRATQLLNEALRQRPDEAEWQYYLGMTHYRLKQPAQSKPALQKAVALKLRGELATEANRVLAELK